MANVNELCPVKLNDQTHCWKTIFHSGLHQNGNLQWDNDKNVYTVNK